MSFYRPLLAAVAAMVIASPVFADDAAANAAAQNPSAMAAPTQTVDGSSSAANDQQATSAAVKTNLNKANAKELAQIQGLNASKAKAIVAYRKKHGEFKSINDLSKVKGFSKMKADDLRSIEDQLTVE